MSRSLQSLVASGTKLYLDSVHPDEVQQNLAWGATGATSNPAIITDIIKSGAYDERIQALLGENQTDEEIAWTLTDELVRSAQQAFEPIWRRTEGNEGWVSFELDPLLEDPAVGLSDAQRSERYLELGKRWSAGHLNRMIKVPATAGGIGALEGLAAAGVTLNVTLIFTDRQYRAARDAIARGFAKCKDKSRLKSVYSVFISRIDIYAEQHLKLSSAAFEQVGILNAKRVWRENTAYWNAHPLPLAQEMIFASTGTKKPNDAPWKYVAALAGADIQTNPPDTNRAIANNPELSFTRQVDVMPAKEIQAEIDAALDADHMERVLMEEGLAKFVKPQRLLLSIIAQKRQQLVAAN